MIYITSTSSFHFKPLRSSLIYLASAFQLIRKQMLNKLIERLGLNEGMEDAMNSIFLLFGKTTINLLPYARRLRGCTKTNSKTLKYLVRHGDKGNQIHQSYAYVGFNTAP